jgi:hypothetical protein
VLFTSDWRAGPRFALCWLALGLCLLVLVALAVVFFTDWVRLSWSDGLFVLFAALPALGIFAATSLLVRVGLRTPYVLVFAAVCLVALTAYTWRVHVERAANGAVNTVATQTVAAPGGQWSLVAERSAYLVDEASTTVYLQPSAGGDRVRLYEGDTWVGKRAVRWADARTVSVAGKLQMPFVEHGLATDSAATSGVPLDAAGYVRNIVAEKEFVTLLSGLSLAMPAESPGLLSTRRSAAGDAPWQRLTPAAASSWSVETLRRRSDLPVVALAGRPIGRSSGGHIVVRWNPAAHRIFVVTDLPRRMVGLVEVTSRAGVAGAVQARAETERIWRSLGLQGAELPWTTPAQ